MNDDPAEAICDALVEYLKALQEVDPSPFKPWTFAATKPDDVLAQLKLEHEGLQIMLTAHSEEEEKKGRGGQVLEQFNIHMLVIKKLSDEFTRAKLTKLVRTLRAKIRTAGKMAGYTYKVSETIVKCDRTQLSEKKQFLSVVQLSYIGMG